MAPGSRAAGILLERDVAIQMRDGTLLRADVWRPQSSGRFPTLLQRFPYDKSAALASIVLAGVEPARAVQAGFVVVVQDTRGRFASDGVFTAFADEARDGADTIAWIRQQPFSNGQVGMYGVSYGGATQLLAAGERPQGLLAIAPHLSGAETYEGWIYEGGAFRLGFALWWAANSFARAELARRRREGGDVADLAASLEKLLRDPWSAFRQLPLNGLEVVNELFPSYLDWVEHPARDAFWRAGAFLERIGEPLCPALHIGGWNDIFLSGTLRNHAALGGRLIVGPWAHAVPFDVIGEADYGPEATQGSLDMTALHLGWFAEQLSTAGSPDHDNAAPVRLFVMGANRWRDEPAWPLARATERTLFLRSGGALAPDPPPDDDPPDSFVYDPLDPVPTAGGATFLPGLYVARHAGPQDQAAVEARADVLTYTSDVLTAPTELTGHVTVDPPRRDVRGRHRLDSQARRRVTRRALARPARQHRARALQPFHRTRGVAGTGAAPRVHDPPGCDQRADRARPPASSADLELELPQVRPQPEPRRGHSSRARLGLHRRRADDLS